MRLYHENYKVNRKLTEINRSMSKYRVSCKRVSNLKNMKVIKDAVLELIS
jgi:hypothetical protein